MKRHHLLERNLFGVFMFLILFYSVGASLNEPIFSRFVEGWVADPLLIGIIVSLPWIFYTLTAEPAGAIIDKIGEKKAVLFGGFLDALGYILLYFANSIYVLALAMIIEGIGSGFFWSATRTHIANSSKGKTGKSFGLYEASWGIGWAIGPIVGGFLALAWEIRLPFLFSGMLIIVATLIMSRSIKGKKIDKINFLYELEGGFIKDGIRFLRNAKKGVKRILLLQLLMNASTTILFVFIPLYFIQLNHAEIGISIFFYSLILGTSSILWGYLGDKFGKRWFVVSGFMFSGIIIFFTLSIFNFFSMIAFMVVLGLTLSLAEPNLVAVLNDRVNHKSKGIANGISIASFGLGGSIGPILGGAIGSAFGLGSAFIFVTAVCLISSLIAFTLWKK